MREYDRQLILLNCLTTTLVIKCFNIKAFMGWRIKLMTDICRLAVNYFYFPRLRHNTN